MEPIEKEKTMLVDIQYVKPNRKLGQSDYLYYIYKDLDTGEKKLQAIVNPKMTIYYEKPEFRTHRYPIKYAKLDQCIAKTVPYKDIIYDIADEIGPKGKEFIKQCYETGNYQGLKEIYAYPYSFGADIDIRMWYRYHWKKMLHNDRPKVLSKGFADIEVDSYETPGMPNPQMNPVDLITIIDDQNNASYTFALIGVSCVEKDTSNMTPTQEAHEWLRRKLYEHRLKDQEYWSTHIEELEAKAHEMFDENYPGMSYHFFFYKDEKKLLVHFWQLVNKLKLDILAFWNIAFDIPYMIERCTALGLDPKTVMCHPDFPAQECFFKKDRRHFDVKNKTDFFNISSYTIFIDQMVSYAALRKVNSELRNFRLNYIAKKELQDEKLDYSDNGSIKTISYNNYLQYVLYNIKDVLLQKGIEHRTNDFDSIYLTAYNNCTPYEDVFKSTKTLTGAQYESYMKQGIVPRNNINAIYNQGKEEPEESDEEEGSKEKVGYEGALVGNPLLIDYFGAKLYGRPSRSLFYYSMDFDMGAFYPSTIVVFNITENGEICKCYIDAEQFDVRGGKLKYHGITDVQMIKEKQKKKDPFSGNIGKEVCDNYQTRNYLSFAYKWFNLPSVNDVYKMLKKKLK